MHIINAKLPDYDGLQRLDIGPDQILRSIKPMAELISEPLAEGHGRSDSRSDAKPGLSPKDASSTEIIDAQGDWISPSGIDVQINGGLGLAFPDIERDHPEHPTLLDKIAAFLWDQGVDGFLPTIVTSSVAQIQASLAAFNDLIPTINGHPQRANILGVHLEGPFLNSVKRGAHPEEHLLPLTLDQVKRVLGDYSGVVKVMTLAPELDETGTVIPYLQSLGITVSLGHSLATATEATRAFDQGATMVTHAFNAMPSLHHRKPGLLGAALTHPTVTAGFIADGEHICPTMLKLLLSANANLFLVSDALAPLGLPDGLYPWDTRKIQVTDGTARLLDGTLSGTTLPLLAGVENLVKWDICDAETAIALATTAPRRAIGLPPWAIGHPIHPLRWQQDADTQVLMWQRLSG